MRIAPANLPKASEKNLPPEAAGLLFLLVHLISGCAVMHDSASFYQDQPRRPINWREYISD